MWNRCRLGLYRPLKFIAMHSCVHRFAMSSSCCFSKAVVSSLRAKLRVEPLTANKCPARLPLSTVEMYAGCSTSSVSVWYQLNKWPSCLASLSMAPSVVCKRLTTSWVVIQPNWRAQVTDKRYRPMLVGDVRCASVGSPSICKLSGGKWLSSGVMQCSKKRQVSCAMPVR